jgi:hypothetical protein
MSQKGKTESFQNFVGNISKILRAVFFIPFRLMYEHFVVHLVYIVPVHPGDFHHLMNF